MPDQPYTPDYYAQGERAAKAGKTVDDNANPDGSPAAYQWLEGYLSMRARIDRGEV